MIGYLWAAALDIFSDGIEAPPFYTQHGALLFVLGALLYWLEAAAHYLLVAFQTSRDAETRAFEQTLLASEAELRALRAQIDPHVIFNSLHSISALTTTDVPAARKMCLLLADLSPRHAPPRHEQPDHVRRRMVARRAFLAIEQVRLGTRLRIAHENDPCAAGCPVPPLLLQTLVENAVIHGLSQLIQAGTIRMTSHRDGSTLTVMVAYAGGRDRRILGGAFRGDAAT